MRRLWGPLVSLRATAVILAVLSAFLLANVVLPQADFDPASHADAVRRGGLVRVLLVSFGLGRLSTSWPFLAVLAAFLVNLAAVLVDRTGVVLRRLRVAAPPAAQLERLLDAPGGRTVDAAPEAVARARDVLATLGYVTADVGPGVVWGVKHRVAVLGFPLFHAAFFVLAVGGVLLYLTRDVLTVGGAEGQWLDVANAGVVRRAPLGPPPPVRLALERVDVALEDGKPIDLAASLRLGGPDGPVQTARVNHPAVWGDLTVLVERAGIAPVLWLVDERGFTLDRVAVVTSAGNGLPTRVRLGDGSVEAVVDPVPVGAAFPVRTALDEAAVKLRLQEGGRDVFEGALRPGEGVAVGPRTVRLQEVRYWAGLRLVSERGGGWLVAGFVLAVVGIVWRMLWYRREIALAWADGRLRIGGRGEFYPGRVAREVARIADLVEEGAAPRSRRSAS